MLKVQNIKVSFDGIQVLDECALEVREREIVVLLGPSGCGKSTLLRTVAGLENLETGKILWNEEDMTTVPPHKRGFGLMFQNHALFPHRNVEENIDFGLQILQLNRTERQQRVKDLLNMVGLEKFEKREIGGLSGGEAQRVALARSLAPKPRLLMLDEPMASLDRALRDRLLIDISNLLRDLNQAAIYVTHDHDEAFSIADRIAIMHEGKIERIGTPNEVWLDPGSETAAQCIGHENFVNLDSSGNCALGKLGSGPGTVLIREDGISVVSENTEIVGEVKSATFHAGLTFIKVQIGDLQLSTSTATPVKISDQINLEILKTAVVPLR